MLGSSVLSMDASGTNGTSSLELGREDALTGCAASVALVWDSTVVWLGTVCSTAVVVGRGIFFLGLGTGRTTSIEKEMGKSSIQKLIQISTFIQVEKLLYAKKAIEHHSG